MSVEGKENKFYSFFDVFYFYLGVRMGRIPKSVKEKALAEYQLSSSSTENDEPSPSIISENFTSTNFELELIDEQFLLDDLNSISFDHPPVKLPTHVSYILPNNFTIDETRHNDEENCTVNYEEQFSNDVMERIEILVTKISHTIINTELGYEEASFIRYLRWKIIDLSHTYNERTRQLVERMKTMINLDVNDKLLFN
jgi:hypothetical protein